MVPEHSHILQICDYINSHQLTPKKFFHAFLQNNDLNAIDRRKKWYGKGLPSTMDLLKVFVEVLTKKEEGKKMWHEFVLEHAIEIVKQQQPKSGYYPQGSFLSSAAATASFFSEESKQSYNDQYIVKSMPFLHNLVLGALSTSVSNNDPIPTEADETLVAAQAQDDQQGLDLEEIAYGSPPTPQLRATSRFQCISKMVCGMVAFTRNRRHNGMQLRNGIQLLACGVTERVNQYLMYHGLSCSRRTAMAAINTLSSEAEMKLKDLFRNAFRKFPIAPIICIDNLDIEERVHTHSTGHRNHTFHGKWGYVHLPSDDLLNSLDMDEINLTTFHSALKKIPSFQVDPYMFMPTLESEVSYKAVWKSQIAHVLSQYLASPSDPSQAININPPEVDPISSTPPKIHMLKLMEAPENSSEGIGHVLDSVAEQAGLSPEEFFSKMLLFDGDLATCRNFNSLKFLCNPSEYPRHSLQNVSFQLGASHTLWNIAQCIFKTHFGNPESSLDTGAWRVLHALGVPHERAMPKKKDYTLMLKYIERVHEATILYCLKVVMKTDLDPVMAFDGKNPKPTIPTAKYNQIIEDVYARFCTGEARATAYERSSPKLNNLLLRLHEFSTVVEADRAMKAGDIGRLMNVWKMWAVMSQSLKGLRNYSLYLPRLIVFLNEILPGSLGKLFRHSLLFSPSGRPNHFVSKDFYLEIQNYWLKFVFNNSGIGTDVDRLKDTYSLNIHLG
ncbi:uncharacterized protein PGTG_17896 [Puccinia graminis f. sp. tritici CRL 75-36-700-3]|uniref:DUF6589 domain-containing protein n=1 Tax=Puccinia graminis f. sp. tritici (strain CRL 75-36-700-3 / race SCCL) TaxID=418459 RepID=E3L6J1_PUCGT|nr:uncharacterized protein PGTG_17896 [Puccinia graminis f. sp. tritici CRL 75-36-700-3]EFP92166.2 hypothetical protein PGTG_17896 [Puccinia graminis f. sp. tritici CRL 75-36-700-3]